MKTNFMRICGGRMKEAFQLPSVRIIVDFILLICYVVKMALFSSSENKGRCVTQIALFGI
jgi:hypothetical protein